MSDEFDRWRDETVAALRGADSARIDVYVRSLLPPPGAKESQIREIDQFERFAEQSLIDDVSVNVWGERICLCDACRNMETGRVMLGTIRDLQSWGDDFDASVSPFFEHSKVASTVTDGTYEGISPPRVTAALYVAGSLAGVFPCRFGEDSYSVRDLSETLKSELDSDETGEADRVPAENDTRKQPSNDVGSSH